GLRARGPGGRQGHSPALREPAAESLAAPLPTDAGRRGGSALNPSKLRRLLALLVLGLSVAGCSGLLRSNARPVQVYTLRADDASPNGVADPGSALSLSL